MSYQVEDNLKIIQEIQDRNNAMKELQEDIENLTEITIILSQMVKEQGENMEIVEKNIKETNENLEVTVESLKQSESYVIAARNEIRNTIIVIGGVSLGALGFIAGPIIGAITTLSGIAAGLGVVFVSEKKVVNQDLKINDKTS